MELPQKFYHLQGGVLKRGYTKDVLYIKVKIKNTSKFPLKRVLYFDQILTGEVDLILEDKVIKTGSSIPLSKRQVNSVYTAFELSFAPEEEKEILLRKYGIHVFNSKLLLTDEFNFYKLNNKKINIFRFYSGAMLALLIYNFFIALFTKSRMFFVYCGYLAALYLTVVGSQGVIDLVDIFSTTTLSQYLVIFSSSSVIFAYYFTRDFLDTHIYYPVFKKIAKYGSLLALVPILNALAPWYDSTAWIFGNYIDILIGISILMFLSAGVIVAIKRHTFGYIYLLSWSFLFLGAFLYLGSVHGFLPRNFIYNNGLLFGNVFEMLVLSLGLGYQITVLQKEKEVAVKKAQVKEKSERLVRVLSHDIASSLQVAILYLTRMKKNASDEKMQRGVEKALTATDNITKILNHVRDEQRLEEAKENVICSKVNLAKALDKTLFIFDEKASAKGVTLRKPQCDEIFIWAEETTLVNNVLGNIISNAIKFTPENSSISIDLDCESDKATLTIQDQGSGFSDDVLEQFKNKSFISSHTGTSGERGTGFGLRIIDTYMSLYTGSELSIFNDNGAVYKLSFKLS